MSIINKNELDPTKMIVNAGDTFFDKDDPDMIYLMTQMRRKDDKFELRLVALDGLFSWDPIIVLPDEVLTLSELHEKTSDCLQPCHIVYTMIDSITTGF